VTTATKPARRDYRTKDGKRLPSVTTIIGDSLGWSKNGLLGWAYRVGCQATADELAEKLESRDVNREDVAFAAECAKEKRAHQAHRDKAATAGTIAHAMIEAHVTATAFVALTDVDDAVMEAAKRAYANFLRWWMINDVKVIHTEMLLVDEVRGFGGTFDAVLQIGGRMMLVDFKTGGVFDEVCLQLGAYDSLCDTNGIAPMDHGMIINVPVDEAKETQIFEVSRTQLDLGRDLFLSCLHIYKNKTAMKLVRGEK